MFVVVVVTNIATDGVVRSYSSQNLSTSEIHFDDDEQ